jgi:hypothetical protein
MGRARSQQLQTKTDDVLKLKRRKTLVGMPREVTAYLGQNWQASILSADSTLLRAATLQISKCLHDKSTGSHTWQDHSFQQGLRLRVVLHELYKEAVSRHELEAYSQALHEGFARRAFTVSKGVDREGLLRLHYDYLLPDHLLRSQLQVVNEYARSGAMINKALAGAEVWQRQRWLKDAVVLDHLMSRVASETVLLRGFRSAEVAVPGEVIQHQGYLSVTAARAVAKGFAQPTKAKTNGYLLELKIPEGTPYLSVWMGSSQMSHAYLAAEQEVLLGRGLGVRMLKQQGVFADNVQAWQAEIVLPDVGARSANASS